MPVFQVIDTTASGDTRYEGFVKDAANWSVAETALSGETTKILVGGGVGSPPVMTAATGTGAPVRATSPTLVTPVLGTPASGSLVNCTGVPLHSQAVAENDFLVGAPTPFGSWIKKTLAEVKTILGLGTIATQNANAVTISGGSVSGITDLAVADGGTGASTAGDARTNLGLGTAAVKNITVSTSDASGGSDGDIWFKREA